MKELKFKIIQAKIKFNLKQIILSSSSISLEDVAKNKCIQHRAVWYVFVVWSIGVAEKKTMDSFKMSCYKRILKIKLVDRIR